jgi:aminoglycoside N3'-acetyltransferase
MTKKTDGTVTRTDIANGLRAMGLREADLVLAHCSLSAFGYVAGGADAVIDALLDVVGPTGTLVMPSHNDVAEHDTAGYDPRTTPVRKNIGRIPDTFWRRPRVRRGEHPPRHPWAAQGPRGEALIALSESRPIGSQHYAGILNAIADLGGYILLLGCMHTSSTSVHTAEAAAFNAVENAVQRRAEFLHDFNEVDIPLQESGVLRTSRIGDAEIRLMLSRDLFAVVQRMYETIHRGKAFKVEDYADEPGFMPAAEYPNVLKAIRQL